VVTVSSELRPRDTSPEPLSARPEIRWSDLGRMPYGRAWALQRALVEARKAGRGCDRLLLVEHDPVLTLGRRSNPAHILVGADALAARGIRSYSVERGGDVTWHGPGQLVAYPILDLQGFRKDVRWYSGALAEAALRCLAEFGIAAEAREGVETGVWVPLGPASEGESWGKIAALGLRIERWIAYHGIALNVDPALEDYDLIVACGLPGVRSISMAGVLGRSLTLDEVRPAFLRALARSLGAEMIAASAAETEGLLELASEAEAGVVDERSTEIVGGRKPSTDPSSLLRAAGR
jgi:lipoate-protein ligase B